jgi:acetolactate synthase-1/2/3 large subunit
MASSGKAAYRVRAPEDALGVLKRAVADAFSHPRGPVSVEIPIDVQRAAVQRPASLDLYTLPEEPPLPPNAAEFEELVRLVAAARRPMLWVGRGASHAGQAVEKLLDLGFGMVTSWAGRGVVSEDHPRNLGGLNGAGLTAVETFYEGVDLMLVVGSRLRGHETVDFTTALPKNLVRIDVDPRADGRAYANTAFVQGDARTVLEALVKRLNGKMNIDPAFPDEFAHLKRTTREAFARSLGPYATFAEQLRAVLPRDTIWSRDVTINNSTWGHKLFPIHNPNTNIYPIGAGIGQGMCLGIGAALAPGGRKTAVLIGDGGFALSLCELWTAIQEQLDIVIIVANDSGYGVIRHIQDKAAGGRRRFDTLAAPDLGELAKVAGVPFWRVDRPDAFGSAVAEAVAATGPTLVEIDMTTIGHHPPYFPYGPRVG